MISMLVSAIVLSADAHAQGSPSWVGRAKQIVARINVPPRATVGAQKGTGFVVGFEGQTLYLVTAGHVIWPGRLPQNEIVKLEVALRGCDEPLPAVASSVQASSREDLDAALVKIHLADVPKDVRARCEALLAHPERLPRHILDPNSDSLAENAPAWLIAPGDVFEGVDARPLTFKQYVRNTLQFTKSEFQPGDSGSPVFSQSGHIIGMVVTDQGLATRFSLILTALENNWESPTSLAGPYTRLRFSDRYKSARVSIDRAPEVPLTLPHPAPLGTVTLELRLNMTDVVADTVRVQGADMSCSVTISRWLARHRRGATYTTLGLIAVTGAAIAIAGMSRHSFEQSPSRSSYDNVRLFNAITIGAGSAAFGSLGATVFGYLSSDRTSITCREGLR